MPHKGVPRAMRKERHAGSYRDPAESAKVRPLTEGNVVVLAAEKKFNRRQNWVSTMSDAEISEARTIITTRFGAAEPTTDAIAAKMEAWEKQHAGEWMDSEHDDEGHIFLNKTLERVQTVGSFLHGMVLQIPRMVEFHPAPTSLIGLEEMWRRAKLKEVLQNYYFDDLWRIRHTLLPDYIRTFLKFSCGIIKTDYHEDQGKPDLRFVVKDRGLQYIDPHARRMRDAAWWIEKEFYSREAVEEMFRFGSWHRPSDFPDLAPSAIVSGTTGDSILKRLYGANFNSQVPVPADELVEVWHYYQAPTNSRPALYSVLIGGTNGWLARHGPNPFAYKGIPYRGGSFDPHEWRVDGTGLVAMHTALQEIINTALNMRLDDWRNNLWNPVFIPEDLVDSTTRRDWDERQKLIRVSKEVWKMLSQVGGDINKLIGKFPISSEESMQLYQDLNFFLGQMNEIGHAGDVFRGQSPSKVTTGIEIQEVMAANQGAFRPAFMSIMHTVEEIAEISQAYFADPDFYGPERLVIATDGRYEDVIQDWQFSQGNFKARAVSFDETDVDITITAVNAADALLSRTFRAGMIQNIFAAIGQVPGMFETVQDRLDFVPMILDLIRSVVTDVDRYERSAEDAAKLAQERAQGAEAAAQKQQQMQVATQVQILQAVEAAKAKREVAVLQAKTEAAVATGQAEAEIGQQEAEAEQRRKLEVLSAETEGAIRKIVTQVTAENQAKIGEMLREHMQTMQRMVLEQRLEVQAAKQTGAAVSVGVGGNAVNQQ